MNWKIILLAGGALATVIIIVWIIKKMKQFSSINAKSTLESCFGEPLTADTFTLQEAKQWVKSRKDKIQNGCKAVIMKANTTTLKNLGKQFEIEVTEDNYLVIAVMDMISSKMEDSVLIRYHTLDGELESAVEKGDGVLVIGG